MNELKPLRFIILECLFWVPKKKRFNGKVITMKTVLRMKIHLDSNRSIHAREGGEKIYVLKLSGL